MAKRIAAASPRSDDAAGNGLLHRRALLDGGIALGGLAAAAAFGSTAEAAGIGANAPDWMKKPGTPFSGYGMPSRWRENVQRSFQLAPLREGSGSSRTPLELLEGTLTPNGLHFERHHNGVPDIDPAKHQLIVHGLVQNPLAFTLESLLRYPMETHIRFIECSGNSGGVAAAAQPVQASAGTLHGLLSCSEWTGVRLATLLDEAGILPAARWVLAEGADAAGMSRSIPLTKCMDDAVIALFQNGEAIRPEQGFPMRLLLPGYEGNANVKWLRRLKLTEGPTYTRDETSKYTDLMGDGRARMFTLDLGVKSLILKPSFGLNLQGVGYYEVSGLAWSGSGRVAKVEISADGGHSWAEAALTAPVLPKALTRFRLPWRWEGQPAVLISRATDEQGQVQPTRTAWHAQYAASQTYHYNALQAWAVDPTGAVKHVYV